MIRVGLPQDDWGTGSSFTAGWHLELSNAVERIWSLVSIESIASEATLCLHTITSKGPFLCRPIGKGRMLPGVDENPGADLANL